MMSLKRKKGCFLGRLFRWLIYMEMILFRVARLKELLNQKILLLHQHNLLGNRSD
jgi:hypothetical protein